MRIAILEDDPVALEFVNATLSQAGHVCKTFVSGWELVRWLRRETFDLLILDWVLPDLSGEDVMRWANHNLPERPLVLFLTNRRQDDDIITILTAGADEYLVKPISPGVLLARVNALTRRLARADPVDPASKLNFREFEFDLARQVLCANGHYIATTQKEFDTALLLFRNLGRSVSRGHLLDIVWKQAPDTPSRTVDTNVSAIRNKLGLRPENGYVLKPIYGYGYRLDLVDQENDT